MAAGAVVIGLGTTGYLMGAAAMDPAQRAPAAAVWLVVVNLAAMYVAVGGTTFLVSAMCSRRARAIAIAFGIVLASFLLNFLAQTWEPARRLAFLGLLEYYQPARVLEHGPAALRRRRGAARGRDRRVDRGGRGDGAAGDDDVSGDGRGRGSGRHV